MSILKAVLAELLGMFVADIRLTAAILCVVAAAAVLVDLMDLAPLLGGAVLLAGCLGVTVAGVLLGARRVRRR